MKVRLFFYWGKSLFKLMSRVLDDFIYLFISIFSVSVQWKYKMMQRCGTGSANDSSWSKNCISYKNTTKDINCNRFFVNHFQLVLFSCSEGQQGASYTVIKHSRVYISKDRWSTSMFLNTWLPTIYIYDMFGLHDGMMCPLPCYVLWRTGH